MLRSMLLLMICISCQIFLMSIPHKMVVVFIFAIIPNRPNRSSRVKRYFLHSGSIKTLSFLFDMLMSTVLGCQDCVEEVLDANETIERSYHSANWLLSTVTCIEWQSLYPRVFLITVCSRTSHFRSFRHAGVCMSLLRSLKAVICKRCISNGATKLSRIIVTDIY